MFVIAITLFQNHYLNFLSAKEQKKREWKKERNLRRFLHFSNSLIQKKLSTFFKHSTFIFFQNYKLKIFQKIVFHRLFN